MQQTLVRNAEVMALMDDGCRLMVCDLDRRTRAIPDDSPTGRALPTGAEGRIATVVDTGLNLTSSAPITGMYQGAKAMSSPRLRLSPRAT